MRMLTLKMAETIVAAALDKAASLKLKPLAVAVLDMRGALKAYAAQDGTSLFRFGLSSGKAGGALGMGFGSAELARRARENPSFVHVLAVLSDGGAVPSPGGVLIRDDDGEIMGAVGVTGDSGENDEACAVAGILAAGLKADPG